MAIPSLAAALPPDKHVVLRSSAPFAVCLLPLKRHRRQREKRLPIVHSVRIPAPPPRILSPAASSGADASVAAAMQETGAPTASPAATTPTGGDAGADGGAMAGSLASGAGWTEHLSPDGRRYYHHKARGISSWEKPNELKTRAELSAAAAADSNWKEYTAASGACASQRAGLCGSWEAAAELWAGVVGPGEGGLSPLSFRERTCSDPASHPTLYVPRPRSSACASSSGTLRQEVLLQHCDAGDSVDDASGTSGCG